MSYQDQNSPPYPVHNTKGIKYAMNMFNAPDLRPSGAGPGNPVFKSEYGRHLAGLDADGRGMETYANELDILAVEDDVQGNGVFDPNLTHGNIHPDSGVFSDHQSLPGNIAREHFYSPSEVTDLTTGKPVNYVPGGAVSFQQGQEETFYELPEQVSPINYPDVEDTSNWIPHEASRPISGAEEPGTTTSTINWAHVGIAVALGAAAGVALGYVVKK